MLDNRKTACTEENKYLSVGSSDELVKSGLVLGRGDLSDSNAGGVLKVNEVSQASLALHDDVRDLHLAAQSGQPQDELDGVNIVSDDDQLGLALLNEGGDVAQTELEHLSRTNKLFTPNFQGPVSSAY